MGMSGKPEAAKVRKTVAASFRNGFSSSVSSLFQFAFQLMMNHLLMRAGRLGSMSGELGVAVFDLLQIGRAHV